MANQAINMFDPEVCTRLPLLHLLRTLGGSSALLTFSLVNKSLALVGAPSQVIAILKEQFDAADTVIYPISP